MGGSGGSECFKLFMAIAVWTRQDRTPLLSLDKPAEVPEKMMECDYNSQAWQTTVTGIKMNNRNLKKSGHVVRRLSVCLLVERFV